MKADRLVISVDEDDGSLRIYMKGQKMELTREEAGVLAHRLGQAMRRPWVLNLHHLRAVETYKNMQCLGKEKA